MARATAHFFLLGAAILAARVLFAAVASPEPTSLEVVVPASAGADEVRQAVDEAMLIEEGLRRGWARTDPVIHRRLVRNMRFVDGEPDDGPPLDAARERALVERAMRLEMHRSDPVVRRRLLERAERAIARSSDERPTEEALRAYLDAHHERFGRPARVRLSQVFLGREQHGEGLDDAVERVAARLARDAPPPEEAHRLGDPFPLAPRGGTMSLERISRTFGPRFAEAVAMAPVGRWAGPYESAYGRHFVFVHEVEPGEVPPLSEVREQVVRSLRHDRLASARAAFLRRLRPYYRVHIVRRVEDDR